MNFIGICAIYSLKCCIVTVTLCTNQYGCLKNSNKNETICGFMRHRIRNIWMKNERDVNDMKNKKKYDGKQCSMFSCIYVKWMRNVYRMESVALVPISMHLSDNPNLRFFFSFFSVSNSFSLFV